MWTPAGQVNLQALESGAQSLNFRPGPNLWLDRRNMLGEEQRHCDIPLYWTSGRHWWTVGTLGTGSQLLEKVKQVAPGLLGSWAPGTWALGYLGRLKMSGVVLLSSRRKLESHSFPSNWFTFKTQFCNTNLGLSPAIIVHCEVEHLIMTPSPESDWQCEWLDPPGNNDLQETAVSIWCSGRPRLKKLLPSRLWKVIEDFTAPGSFLCPGDTAH